MSSASPRITRFELAPGRIIAGKYVVGRRLGAGWEGEVYEVQEKRTGVRRAAKLFFPHRNPGDRIVRESARRLEQLRGCSTVIQYHHSETYRFRGREVTCLVSELVEGTLLSDLVSRSPRRRLGVFEALHLTHTLARGLEEIHERRAYHGDLHDGNVMVLRRGIFFSVKVLDFFHRGRFSRANVEDDVVDLTRLLYDSVGGRVAYAKQPEAVKAICRGLRRDLILERFPTAAHLRRHLESFDWET